VAFYSDEWIPTQNSMSNAMSQWEYESVQVVCTVQILYHLFNMFYTFLNYVQFKKTRLFSLAYFVYFKDYKCMNVWCLFIM